MERKASFIIFHNSMQIHNPSQTKEWLSATATSFSELLAKYYKLFFDILFNDYMMITILFILKLVDIYTFPINNMLLIVQ